MDLQELSMVQVGLENAQQKVIDYTNKRKESIVACLNNGNTVKEISTSLGISQTRVYKIVERDDSNNG